MSAFTEDNLVGTFSAAPTTALVPPEERQAHYARILESHAQDRALELSRARGRWWREGIQVGTIIVLAGAIMVMMPLKQLTPVFVDHDSNGTFTTTVNQNDLPVSLRRATMASTLWLYTRAREGYTSATHFNTDQQIVYMMSDKATGDAYQASVQPKNKESPWAKYGTRTTVRLERVSETLSCGGQQCDAREPDTYQIRYRRIEQTEGRSDRRTQYLATARFKQPDRIPAWQRVTVNPVGLQVVEWVVTEEGAAQ